MPKKQTAREMRKELVKVCDKIPPRSCGSRACRLSRMCATFGNPRTTDAASIFGTTTEYLLVQNNELAKETKTA